MQQLEQQQRFRSMVLQAMPTYRDLLEESGVEPEALEKARKRVFKIIERQDLPGAVHFVEVLAKAHSR